MKFSLKDLEAPILLSTIYVTKYFSHHNLLGALINMCAVEQIKKILKQKTFLSTILLAHSLRSIGGYASKWNRQN